MLRDTIEWESHYSQTLKIEGISNVDLNQRTPYIDNLLKYSKGIKNSLEFGSGKGGLSLLLKMKRPKIHTTLLDYSPGAIKFSKLRYKHYHKTGKFICGSFLNMPFKNETFDFVHGNTSFEHVSNSLKAAEELVRVTKKGGYILITVPNAHRKYTGHDLYHYINRLQYFSRTFYFSELEKLFEDNNCEVVDRFGVTLIFFAPTYIPRLLYELFLDVRRKLFSKKASNRLNKNTSTEDIVNYKRIYTTWLYPFYLIDRLWLYLQDKINYFFDYILKLHPSAYVTIGIVFRKK
jgi:SAM-dependent methyltransferase